MCLDMNFEQANDKIYENSPHVTNDDRIYQRSIASNQSYDDCQVMNPMLDGNLLYINSLDSEKKDQIQQKLTSIISAVPNETSHTKLNQSYQSIDVQNTSAVMEPIAAESLSGQANFDRSGKIESNQKSSAKVKCHKEHSNYRSSILSE